MFCPVCGSEYRPGFLTCVDCEVPLVDQPPARVSAGEAGGDDADADMATVYEADDAEHLDAAIGRLRQAEIVHSWGPMERSPSADREGLSFPDSYLAPGTVRVRADDASEARLWLANLEESVIVDRDALEHYGLADKYGEGADLVYCPRCGISQAARLGPCVDCGGTTVQELPRDWRPPDETVFATRSAELLAAARQALAGAEIRHTWGPLDHLPYDPVARRSASAPDYGLRPGQVVARTAATAAEARRILAGVPALAPAVVQSPDARTAAALAEAAADRLAPSRDRHDPEATARLHRSSRTAPAASDLPSAGRREPGVVFCPVCRSEYRAGTATCVDCGAALVEELPPEPEPGLRAADPEAWDQEEIEDEAEEPFEEEGEEEGDAEDQNGDDDQDGDDDQSDDGQDDEEEDVRTDAGGRRHGIVLPGDVGALRLAEESYRAARALAVSSILLPWIVAPMAWRRAELALDGYRRSGLQAPRLETSIRRVRSFGAALTCGSWAALLYYVWRLPAW